MSHTRLFFHFHHVIDIYDSSVGLILPGCLNESKAELSGLTPSLSDLEYAGDVVLLGENKVSCRFFSIVWTMAYMFGMLFAPSMCKILFGDWIG